MKFKTALLTAAATMALCATCMAAPGDNFQMVDIPYGTNHHDYCAEKMASWTERLENGADHFTISNEVSRIYVRNNNRIAYYDEWVAFDKADQKAFARADIAILGGPDKLADKLREGAGDDNGDDGDEG